VLCRRYVVFALGLAMLWPRHALAEQTMPAPRWETIVIETDQTSRMLAVEIADTPALRQRGLMFRHRLAEDRGMLFLYGGVQPVAMWMKNTYIPLDMVFVRADGSIAEVVEGAVPHSLDTIRSREPVLAVLEVAAGSARRLGLRPGAVIRHSFFGNAD
jgi:uncharacterized membrane protein (UPF0127 family)